MVAAAVWVLFAVAFSLYSSRIGAMPASYGLLGTVAALMIFLQLTAVAVIIGAEVNAIVEPVSPTEGVVDAPPASTPEPVGFGRALAGLVALYVLGRGS